MLSLLYLRKTPPSGGYPTEIVRTHDKAIVQTVFDRRFVKGNGSIFLTKSGEAYKLSGRGRILTKIPSMTKFVDCSEDFLISKEGDAYYISNSRRRSTIVSGPGAIDMSGLKFLKVSGKFNDCFMDTNRHLWFCSRTWGEDEKRRTFAAGKVYLVSGKARFTMEQLGGDVEFDLFCSGFSDVIASSGSRVHMFYGSGDRLVRELVREITAPDGSVRALSIFEPSGAVVDSSGVVIDHATWNPIQDLPPAKDFTGNNADFVVLTEDNKSVIVGSYRIPGNVDRRIPIRIEGGVFGLVSGSMILTKKRISNPGKKIPRWRYGDRTATMCNGITKKGVRCTKMTMNDDYCEIHEPKYD